MINKSMNFDTTSILLSNQYKRFGKIVLIGGIPAILLVITALVILLDLSNFDSFWDEWGLFILHIPLSIGLYWILFAREKEEDEMLLQLRLQAVSHGVRFVFWAIIFLPVFTNLFGLITGKGVALPDVGGNLAVVTLLLFYSNLVYWWLKRTHVES